MSVKKRVMKFILILAITYFILLAWLLSSVDSLVFPRSHAGGLTQTPKDLGLKFEEVQIETGDGIKLFGWYVPRDPPCSTTLIYNHGNAENISRGLAHARAIASKLSANLFIYDYRGYAKSEGVPSTKTFYEDCDRVYEYLASRPELKGGRFVIYGRSLGGAAAVHMASKFPCHRLITESTFVSVPLHIWYNPVLFVFYPFVREYLPTAQKAKSVKAPWLIIHGGRDKVISVKNARALYELEGVAAKRSLYIVDEAGHNNVMAISGEEYLKKIYDFASGD